MPLLDPRVTLPQVTQFPQQPLMDPQSLAMLQRRMLGAVPQGLLDTSNAPAGLLGPATVRPGAAAGLLTPVVWDQLRRGVSPMTTTEGARMSGAQGGGGRGFAPTSQYPLDLRGGRGTAPPRPPRPMEWNYDEETGGDAVETPSGMRVVMQRGPRQGGGHYADVMFHESGRSMQSSFISGRTEGSTKRSLDRFGEVYGAVRDYLRNFGADELKFTSASPSHTRLYDKIAPKLAKELGGKLTVPEKGEYRIDLTGE